MNSRLNSVKILTHKARYNLLELPIYLCPRLARALPFSIPKRHQRLVLLPSLYRAISSNPSSHYLTYNSPEFVKWALSKLPRHCPGCGAPTQTVDSHEPGYYDLKRHAIRKFLGITSKNCKKQKLNKQTPKNATSLSLRSQDFETPQTPESTSKQEIVKCFRCRNLQNHRVGISIQHPSVESIRNIIDENSHKYNHVYHVIDAADFPMSVIHNLQDALKVSPLRTKNRRSKFGKFYKDRNIEMSFIITRSDLLAPLKEQVDSIMPYLRKTLRDALGQSAVGMRLGNVRCVSVKRGWWSKELKEEVWNRGGAGWLVGKLNVGKSQLFGSIFPKGRKEYIMHQESKHFKQKVDLYDDSGENEVKNTNSHNIEGKTNTEEIASTDIQPATTISRGVNIENFEPSKIDEEFYDTKSLLPAAPEEVNFPTMPLVSDLPGTTASPIRLPFGNGKGELIDLPGLRRGDLEKYVLPAYRRQLMMRSRVEPLQEVIKPGQSLLLGGIIRITPTAPDIVILAYAFTSIEPHVTNTEKAIGIQEQTRISSVINIAAPGIRANIASAGKYLLKWDVTKKRTGPVTARDATGVNIDQLPYRVLATDILIEGCGWVELVAQVTKRHGNSIIKPLSLDYEDSEIMQELENKETGEIWPGVEVFSPFGKSVMARRPMNAWSFISKKQNKIKASSKRPLAKQKKEKKLPPN